MNLHIKRLNILLTTGAVLSLLGCPNPDPRVIDPPTVIDPVLGDVKRCMAENPGHSAEECDVTRCVTNPLFLLALEDVTLYVTDFMKAKKANYWLEGGSLLAVARGQHTPLAWDDDVDLGMMESAFHSIKDALKSDLESNGFEFVARNAEDGKVALYQVHFGKERMLTLMSRHDPKLSTEEREKQWEAISEGTHGEAPHLDIFTFYHDSTNNKIRYTHPVWEGGTGQYAYDDVFPINVDSSFFGVNMSLPAKPENYLTTEYHSNTIVDDWVIRTEHRTTCSKKVRLKNINDYPQFQLHFKKHNDAVFGAK